MRLVYDALLIDLEQYKNKLSKVSNFILSTLTEHANLIIISNENQLTEIKKWVELKSDSRLFYYVKKERTLYYKKWGEGLYTIVNVNQSYEDILVFIKEISKSQSIYKVTPEDLETNNKICIVPSLSIGETVIEDYAVELSSFIKSTKEVRKKIEETTLDIINENCSYELNDLSSIWSYNGGISFYDYELMILWKEQPSHPIFTLFDADCFSNRRKYCYNTDRGIVLRGPENYYFNLCYVDVDSIFDPVDIFENPLRFLTMALNGQLSEKLDLNNVSDMKVFLAILDVIRNLITIQLYYFVKNKAEKSNMLYLFSNKEDEINLLYNTLKITFSLYLDSLFYKEKSTCIKELEVLIRNIINMQRKLQFSTYKLEDAKHFHKMRNWRETDNIIENIISVSYTIKLARNSSRSIRNCIYWGLNYGSLDLAILAEVIAVRNGMENPKSGVIIVNKSYQDMYGENQINIVAQKHNCMNINIDQTKSIILDDNVISGKSLQAGINLLTSYLQVPAFAFVMRYPSIGRINQMIGPNKKCMVDLKLFNKYIMGLLYSTDFTKICDSEDKNTYFDLKGIFDQAKQDTLNYLYKNQLYSENSLVGLNR